MFDVLTWHRSIHAADEFNRFDNINDFVIMPIKS